MAATSLPISPPRGFTEAQSFQQKKKKKVRDHRDHSGARERGTRSGTVLGGRPERSWRRAQIEWDTSGHPRRTELRNIPPLCSRRRRWRNCHLSLRHSKRCADQLMEMGDWLSEVPYTLCSIASSEFSLPAACSCNGEVDRLRALLWRPEFACSNKVSGLPR